MTQPTQHKSARKEREIPANLRQHLRAFDPFTDPYLADPYPFFTEARTAAPAFYSSDLGYWLVTRYSDIRRIFQTPKLFSAVNALDPIRPVCPAAAQQLSEGGFRPVPTLTNTDPPAHTRARRLANVAFTPRRVAAMEPFVRDLTVQFITDRLSSGRADLVRDFAWELPALNAQEVASIIFGLLLAGHETTTNLLGNAFHRLLSHRHAWEEIYSGRFSAQGGGIQ